MMLNMKIKGKTFGSFNKTLYVCIIKQRHGVFHEYLNHKIMENNKIEFQHPKVIFQSLNEKLENNEISIHDDAVKLYESGWTTSIDVDKTRKILNEWK